jgi:hypothetical protein
VSSRSSQHFLFLKIFFTPSILETKRRIIAFQTFKTSEDEERSEVEDSTALLPSPQPTQPPDVDSRCRKRSHTQSSLAQPPKRKKNDGYMSIPSAAETPDDIYHLDFGKHFGRTIYSAIRHYSGYIDWCLSESVGNLLLSQPELVYGFHAL